MAVRPDIRDDTVVVVDRQIQGNVVGVHGTRRRVSASVVRVVRSFVARVRWGLLTGRVHDEAL